MTKPYLSSEVILKIEKFVSEFYPFTTGLYVALTPIEEKLIAETDDRKIVRLSDGGYYFLVTSQYEISRQKINYLTAVYVAFKGGQYITEV